MVKYTGEALDLIEEEIYRGDGSIVYANAITRFGLQLCSDNAAHFEKLAVSGSNGYNERMPAVQSVLQSAIETLKGNVIRWWHHFIISFPGNIKKLQEVAPKYDYDEKTPGNGYRCVNASGKAILAEPKSFFVTQACFFLA